MKTLKRTSLFVIFLLTVWNTFGQREIIVKQYKSSPLFPISLPILIDSMDVNKKPFDEKSLLASPLDFESISGQMSLVSSSDTSGTIQLPRVSQNLQKLKQENAFQVLSFNIDADRYCKAKLTITCTDLFEVYVDGKKIKSKETREDSLSKAKSLDVELTLEPRQCNIFIKRLAKTSTKDVPEIKSILKLDKKMELAQLTVSTEGKRRITINDILEGNRLSSISISPTGTFFIVGFNQTFPGGKVSSSLELRDMKTNRILYRFPSSIRPSWMKKTDKITYTKEEGSEKVLYEMDPYSFEEKVLCQGIPLDYYSFSPDNSFIIASKSESIPEEKGDLKRLLSPSDRSGAYRGRSSLYIYRFQDKSLQRLTFGKTTTWLNDISSDNQKALVISSKEDITQRPFSKKILCQLDLNTLQMDTLIQDSFISGASYSPDNQEIIILGAAEFNNNLGINLTNEPQSNSYDGQAYIMNLKTKQIKPISKNFNPNISNANWSNFDHKIYFQVEDRDRNQVYVYDPRTDKYELLNLKEDMISGFSVAESSPLAIYRGEGTSNAYRLYAYDLKSKSVRLLADPFKNQLDEMSLSKVEDWTFKTTDGTVIDGRYYLPPNFDQNKKYPLIVYYYGGTSPTTRVFESTYPLQVYAALGYVVYTLQPSGTTGYGQEFSARHVNAWGKYTANEIIEGTKKFCQEHSYIDMKKIGCIGASYGGFMTQYLQTQTDLFAAAISHAGISDITSYWGEGYWGYAYSGSASANSFPWNNPKLYVEQSPLFQADKIKTPLLLLHGGADTNVPIGESIQMYNALKILGKTVEFIRVEGENHAIYQYDKRIGWNKTIYAWFAKWLKEEPEWWEALYPDKE